jgi:hypothetical protein
MKITCDILKSFLSFFSQVKKFVISSDMLMDLALQVYLGSAGALDVEGKELPKLVYISREKRPGYPHHKKAGAMNALVISETRF